MEPAQKNREWIRSLAGYTAWLASGLPVLLSQFNHPGPWPAGFALWLTAYAGFIVLYTLALRCNPNAKIMPVRGLLLALETAAALAVSRLSPGTYAFGGILLVVTAAQAADFLGLRLTLAWAAAQSALYGLLMAHDWGGANAALAAVAYFSFQLFAIMVESARRGEQSAREALARAHAELEATHGLLMDGSRAAERMRIARELHDLLGHHLTALSLNLEVAAHHAEGAALPPVEKAKQLTKLLLSDVRAAVSEMRVAAEFDLARAIRILALDLPSPRVHLEAPDSLRVEDSLSAQILLRGAQEILTNAARHAGAQNLWLELVRSEKGLALSARDDGRGAPRFQPGNGFRGMRERIEAAGGALRVDGASGGFRVELWLPAGAQPA